VELRREVATGYGASAATGQQRAAHLHPCANDGRYCHRAVARVKAKHTHNSLPQISNSEYLISGLRNWEFGTSQLKKCPGPVNLFSVKKILVHTVQTKILCSSAVN
jgi:hypothetical protein